MSSINNVYKHHGILPNQKIIELIDRGLICGVNNPEQISASSLDLTLGGKFYRIKGTVLPKDQTENIEKLLEAYAHSIGELGSEGILIPPHQLYVFELAESLNLTEDFEAKCNAKSSTGRLDIFVRLITDGTPQYDFINTNYKGKMYLEVYSSTFPILVRQRSSLAQLRFFNGENLSTQTTRLSDLKLRMQDTNNTLFFDSEGKVITEKEMVKLYKSGFYMSVDLTGERNPSKLIAFKAKSATNPIDVDKKNEYDPLDYWELVPSRDGTLTLERDAFYILRSKEKIRVPLDLSVEISAYGEELGESRVHYSGFAHPGFGMNFSGGEQGSFLIYEVRVRDVPILLRDGQKLAKINFQDMLELPTNIYGARQGHYQDQTLTLSKHFKALK